VAERNLYPALDPFHLVHESLLPDHVEFELQKDLLMRHIKALMPLIKVFFRRMMILTSGKRSLSGA